MCISQEELKTVLLHNYITPIYYLVPVISYLLYGDEQ